MANILAEKCYILHFFLKPSEGRLVVLERSELLRPEAHEGAPLLLEARHLAAAVANSLCVLRNIATFFEARIRTLEKKTKKP